MGRYGEPTVDGFGARGAGRKEGEGGEGGAGETQGEGGAENEKGKG
jgi:hypothetical protein